MAASIFGSASAVRSQQTQDDDPDDPERTLLQQMDVGGRVDAGKDVDMNDSRAASDVEADSQGGARDHTGQAMDVDSVDHDSQQGGGDSETDEEDEERKLPIFSTSYTTPWLKLENIGHPFKVESTCSLTKKMDEEAAVRTKLFLQNTDQHDPRLPSNDNWKIDPDEDEKRWRREVEIIEEKTKTQATVDRCYGMEAKDVFVVNVPAWKVDTTEGVVRAPITAPADQTNQRSEEVALSIKATHAALGMLVCQRDGVNPLGNEFGVDRNDDDDDDDDVADTVSVSSGQRGRKRGRPSEKASKEARIRRYMTKHPTNSNRTMQMVVTGIEALVGVATDPNNPSKPMLRDRGYQEKVLASPPECVRQLVAACNEEAKKKHAGDAETDRSGGGVDVGAYEAAVKNYCETWCSAAQQLIKKVYRPALPDFVFPTAWITELSHLPQDTWERFTRENRKLWSCESSRRSLILRINEAVVKEASEKWEGFVVDAVVRLVVSLSFLGREEENVRRVLRRLSCPYADQASGSSSGSCSRFDASSLWSQPGNSVKMMDEKLCSERWESQKQALERWYSECTESNRNNLECDGVEAVEAFWRSREFEERFENAKCGVEEALSLFLLRCENETCFSAHSTRRCDATTSGSAQNVVAYRVWFLVLDEKYSMDRGVQYRMESNQRKHASSHTQAEHGEGAASSIDIASKCIVNEDSLHLYLKSHAHVTVNEASCANQLPFMSCDRGQLVRPMSNVPTTNELADHPLSASKTFKLDPSSALSHRVLENGLRWPNRAKMQMYPVQSRVENYVRPHPTRPGWFVFAPPSSLTTGYEPKLMVLQPQLDLMQTGLPSYMTNQRPYPFDVLTACTSTQIVKDPNGFGKIIEDNPLAYSDVICKNSLDAVMRGDNPSFEAQKNALVADVEQERQSTGCSTRQALRNMAERQKSVVEDDPEAKSCRPTLQENVLSRKPQQKLRKRLERLHVTLQTFKNIQTGRIQELAEKMKGKVSDANKFTKWSAHYKKKIVWLKQRLSAMWKSYFEYCIDEVQNMLQVERSDLPPGLRIRVDEALKHLQSLENGTPLRCDSHPSDLSLSSFANMMNDMCDFWYCTMESETVRTFFLAYFKTFDAVVDMKQKLGLALVGEPGNGKSTFMQMLSAVLLPNTILKQGSSSDVAEKNGVSDRDGHVVYWDEKPTWMTHGHPQVNDIKQAMTDGVNLHSRTEKEASPNGGEVFTRKCYETPHTEVLFACANLAYKLGLRDDKPDVNEYEALVDRFLVEVYLKHTKGSHYALKYTENLATEQGMRRLRIQRAREAVTVLMCVVRNCVPGYEVRDAHALEFYSALDLHMERTYDVEQPKSRRIEARRALLRSMSFMHAGYRVFEISEHQRESHAWLWPVGDSRPPPFSFQHLRACLPEFVVPTPEIALSPFVIERMTGAGCDPTIFQVMNALTRKLPIRTRQLYTMYDLCPKEATQSKGNEGQSSTAASTSQDENWTAEQQRASNAPTTNDAVLDKLLSCGAPPDSEERFKKEFESFIFPFSYDHSKQDSKKDQTEEEKAQKAREMANEMENRQRALEFHIATHQDACASFVHDSRSHANRSTDLLRVMPTAQEVGMMVSSHDAFGWLKANGKTQEESDALNNDVFVSHSPYSHNDIYLHGDGAEEDSDTSATSVRKTSNVNHSWIPINVRSSDKGGEQKSPLWNFGIDLVGIHGNLKELNLPPSVVYDALRIIKSRTVKHRISAAPNRDDTRSESQTSTENEPNAQSGAATLSTETHPPADSRIGQSGYYAYSEGKDIEEELVEHAVMAYTFGTKDASVLMTSWISRVMRRAIQRNHLRPCAMALNQGKTIATPVLSFRPCGSSRSGVGGKERSATGGQAAVSVSEKQEAADNCLCMSTVAATRHLKLKAAADFTMARFEGVKGFMDPRLIRMHANESTCSADHSSAASQIPAYYDAIPIKMIQDAVVRCMWHRRPLTAAQTPQNPSPIDDTDLLSTRIVLPTHAPAMCRTRSECVGNQSVAAQLLFVNPVAISNDYESLRKREDKARKHYKDKQCKGANQVADRQILAQNVFPRSLQEACVEVRRDEERGVRAAYSNRRNDDPWYDSLAVAFKEYGLDSKRGIESHIRDYKTFESMKDRIESVTAVWAECEAGDDALQDATGRDADRVSEAQLEELLGLQRAMF